MFFTSRSYFIYCCLAYYYHSQLLSGRRNFSDSFFFFTEPKKDKTEGASQNGAVSPSTETPSHISQPPGPGDGIGKLERPNTLAPGKLTRRLLCYHSEHCKFPIVLTNESHPA